MYIAFDTIVKNARLEKMACVISFFIVDKPRKRKIIGHIAIENFR